jgi:hypothetical protein
MDNQDGELLFNVCKLGSGRYVAKREAAPSFRVEGKTITEVAEKAIRVFLWKDEDAA